MPLKSRNLIFACLATALVLTASACGGGGSSSSTDKARNNPYGLDSQVVASAHSIFAASEACCSALVRAWLAESSWGFMRIGVG